MRVWLNKYFGFSKSQFNGLLFLIVIIVFLKALPLLFQYYKPIAQDSPELLSQIQKIPFSNKYEDHSGKFDTDDIHRKAGSKLFIFDPNSLDAAGWVQLGLSAKQAQAILNYRDKGGKFNKVEDLQKMYTISPEMYKKISPYVKITDRDIRSLKTYAPFEKKEYAKKAAVIVDINRADSAQLDEIKGIGGVFASRILKYRDRLGGFYKKEQLMEVYGLDSVKYAEIKDQVSINIFSLKTIHINTADFNDFKRNPYLSYKQINAILQYRKQHGNYSGITDLNKVIVLNQQVIDKIAPYLSF